MAKLEELYVYRVACQFVQDVGRATRAPAFRGEGDLVRQLRRSAISIASNIAEGHGRKRRAEFAHFLLIARGSGVEVQAQLALALDGRRLIYAEYARLRGMADHIVALITKLHAAVVRQLERD